jgi:NTP pyrophosphatase (non-canonical NTP hydrolase)
MRTLTQKISNWHKDRKITVNGNSNTQTIKLGEEYSELCSGIIHGNKELIKDSIGDMVVALIAIAELEGMTLKECVENAYSEIKDRKGYLSEDGVFIKEEV